MNNFLVTLCVAMTLSFLTAPCLSAQGVPAMTLVHAIEGNPTNSEPKKPAVPLSKGDQIPVNSFLQTDATSAVTLSPFPGVFLNIQSNTKARIVQNSVRTEQGTPTLLIRIEVIEGTVFAESSAALPKGSVLEVFSAQARYFPVDGAAFLVMAPSSRTDGIDPQKNFGGVSAVGGTVRILYPDDSFVFVKKGSSVMLTGFNENMIATSLVGDLPGNSGKEKLATDGQFVGLSPDGTRVMTEEEALENALNNGLPTDILVNLTDALSSQKVEDPLTDIINNDLGLSIPAQEPLVRATPPTTLGIDNTITDIRNSQPTSANQAQTISDLFASITNNPGSNPALLMPEDITPAPDTTTPPVIPPVTPAGPTTYATPFTTVSPTTPDNTLDGYDFTGSSIINTLGNGNRYWPWADASGQPNVLGEVLLQAGLYPSDVNAAYYVFLNYNTSGVASAGSGGFQVPTSYLVDLSRGWPPAGWPTN